MNGTMVELKADKAVKAFHVNHDVDDERRYKTVNICSLSSQSWQQVIARLDRYIEDGRVNEYYETVFADMVADGSLEFDAVLFNENKWYEIDAMEDLHKAELMFPRAPAIDLPEHVGFKQVGFGDIVSRSPANSANMVTHVNKTLASDNVVSINKVEPEKIQ